MADDEEYECPFCSRPTIITVQRSSSSVHRTVCADEHQFGGLSAPNDLKGFEMPRQSGPKSNFRCKLLIVNRITALSRFAEPFQNLSNHFKIVGRRGVATIGLRLILPYRLAGRIDLQNHPCLLIS